MDSKELAKKSSKAIADGHPTTKKSESSFWAWTQSGLQALWLTLALFLALSLMTFSSQDAAWSTDNVLTTPVHNTLGTIGAYTADILYYFFGISAWWISFYLFFHAVQSILKNRFPRLSFSFSLSILGLILILLFSPLCELSFFTHKLSHTLPMGAGGLTAHFLYPLLHRWLPYLVLDLISVALVITAFLLMVQSAVWLLYKGIGTFFSYLGQKVFEKPLDENERTRQKLKTISAHPVKEIRSASSNRLKILQKKGVEDKSQVQENIPTSPLPSSSQEKPFLNLIKNVWVRASSPSKEAQHELLSHAHTLEQIFNHFQIANRLEEGFIGPRFINYHLKLNLSNVNEAFASALSALPQNLPTPKLWFKEKSPVQADYAILVKRRTQERVSFMRLLGSKEFVETNQDLVIVLGRSIERKALYAILPEMPNLLIAGQDPKEVNGALITALSSLVARNVSQQLRLLCFSSDPKGFEKNAHLPQLLCPPLHQAKDLIHMLRWLQEERQKRALILTENNYPDIKTLNIQINILKEKGIALPNPLSPNLDEPQALTLFPTLVIFLEQPSLLNKEDYENIKSLLLDLAQKGAKVGLHLIWGESQFDLGQKDRHLKEAFPARLLFTLSDSWQSRWLLGQPGAEKLEGQGDAFFTSAYSRSPVRLQAADLSLNEYQNLVHDFQQENPLPISHYSLEKRKSQTEMHSELYKAAVNYVLESQKTSVSALQRQLHIGYNLAHNFLESMEREGLLQKAHIGAARTLKKHSFTE